MLTTDLREKLEWEFYCTPNHERLEFINQLLDCIGVEAEIIDFPEIEEI